MSESTTFIEWLNQSPITYIRDIGDLGWLTLTDLPTDGYEVYSGPTGEIRVFTDWKSANEWRLDEIKLAMNPGQQRCNCEHTNHFTEDIYGNPIEQKAHDYLTVQLGSHWHYWVGSVCNYCHEICLASEF